MKSKKKSYLIVVLLILLVAIGLGYAALTGTLNINGTATTTNVKVDFVDVSGDTVATTQISGDGQTLTVGDIVLDHPGDSKVIVATIKNNGTVDATIDGFTTITTTGAADKDAVSITITPNTSFDLAKDATTTATITVTWLTSAPDGVTGTVGFTTSADYAQKQ